jgi:glycosyl transferase family 4
MRIAQISPLTEAVPPKFYSGTERIVAYLTDGLVGLGHEVTLSASGDSLTTARLVAGCPQAFRLDPTIRDHIAPLIAMLETAAQRSGEFDVIHLHCDYLGYVALRRAGVPFLATLHGRLDPPELRPLYRAFCEVPVVSISDAQRASLPEAHYIATVPHGLPEGLLLPGSGAGGYLAFLGRIAGEGAGPSDPDRRASRYEVEDRGQGRPRRSGILQGGNRTASGAAPRRIHRRDRRAPESRVPRQCRGIGIPNRLA